MSSSFQRARESGASGMRPEPLGPQVPPAAHTVRPRSQDESALLDWSRGCQLRGPAQR